MVRTETGFAPADGVVEGFLNDHYGDAAPKLQCIEPLIDSANATPTDWDRVAQVIAAEHDAQDGFVVTHGTDTMAYSAAALGYALQGIARPVILTGAMLPLIEPDSDGGRNLTDALNAVETAPPGIWVQFAGKLLHGARVRKTHSRSFDAFNADPNPVPPRRV
ncbi:unnamed protein product, partial [Cyprideis torosa]